VTDPESLPPWKQYQGCPLPKIPRRKTEVFGSDVSAQDEIVFRNKKDTLKEHSVYRLQWSIETPGKRLKMM
jgi:hypothetical protein